MDEGASIAEDIRAGMHVHSACVKYGIRDRKVRYWAAKFGVTPVSCTCLMMRSSALRIAALLQTGMKQTEVADELKISRQRVNEIAREAISVGMKNIKERKKSG